MEETESAQQAQGEFNPGELYSIMRPALWKVAIVSLIVGAVTLAWMQRKPDLYRASATVTPSVEDNKQNPTIGALSYIGVSVGGPSKAEDLDTLFRSNDLAVRVFRKYNLWPVLKPKSFDPATGRFKAGWRDRLLGGRKEGRPPSDWDAIRASQNGLTVVMNRRSGTLSLSFESPSPEGSANIVRYFLEEAKSRLQEEAMERAVRNKKFIEDQIYRISDALTRDRLYSIYGQETEREMLARNREQFGFRIVDSPRVPDRSHKPDRVMAVATSVFISFPLLCVFYGYWVRRKHTRGKAAPDSRM